MPSCAPAIISGIWFIADRAQRARFEVAASGSIAVRREAISANSPPTKVALPNSSSDRDQQLFIGRLQRGDHPHLLDPVPVDLHHGELPPVLLQRLAHHRECVPGGRAGSRPASRTGPRAA